MRTGAVREESSVLVDEDRELEHDDSADRRQTIWGARPGRLPSEARTRRGDWVRASREIWGRAAAPPADVELEPEGTEPLLPVVDVLPAPVEDIIPLPEELPAPSTEGLSWGEQETPYEPAEQDIWGSKRAEQDRTKPRPEAPGSVPRATDPTRSDRFVLPESWAAAPRRRSRRQRWRGVA
jgi:hypothetical protein